MRPNLEISTVVGCRMMCDYCPQKVHAKSYSMRSPQVRMRLDDFKFMLAKVPREVEIVFAGMAEPFLNVFAMDMIRYACEQGYSVGIYTTGYGLEVSEVLILKHLKLAFFALHLPDDEGRMALPMTDLYLETIEAINANLRHTKMVVGRVHPRVHDITGDIEDHSSSLLSRAGNIKLLQINRKAGPLQCSACGPKIDHNVLLPNGDVLLCCMDYAQEHVIGNLMTMEYGQLFESPEYLRIMEGLKAQDSNIICRRCEISTPA